MNWRPQPWPLQSNAWWKDSPAHGALQGDRVLGSQLVQHTAKGYFLYKGEGLAIHGNPLTNDLSNCFLSPPPAFLSVLSTWIPLWKVLATAGVWILVTALFLFGKAPRTEEEMIVLPGDALMVLDSTAGWISFLGKGVSVLCKRRAYSPQDEHPFHYLLPVMVFTEPLCSVWVQE